jgi:hypothetical protein
MVRGTKAAAKPAPEPETPELEPWAEALMGKEPSQVHKNFAEYCLDNMDYEVDLKTVQLVISQYQKFQKSPEQKAFNEARKVAAAEAAAERETRQASAETAPRRGRAAAKAAAEEDEAPATTGRRTRTTRVAAAPAAPAAKRSVGRRRPAATAAAEEDID